MLVCPATAASRPAGAPAKVDSELASLRDFLVGADRTFSTRRDAADGLLSKDTDAARAVLVEVLAGPTPSEPTLATLEAIAGHDGAGDALLDPLFQLLRSEDEPTRRAAATAFGAYQGSEKALSRLKEMTTAAETPPTVRMAAVQALAQIIDRRAIEALVAVSADVKNPASAAAADALADMTGIRDLGPSREAWAVWWKARRDEPEARLLGGLLRRNRDELRRREAALDRVQTRLIRQLTDLYEAADAKEKGKLALTNLEDAVPQVRALGARQSAALAQSVISVGNGAARQPYQELIAAVLKHLNDESPIVRAACAEALAAWKEMAAAPVLLGRLDTEKSPEVRASLAAALGALKMVEAAPKLVAMLESPNEVEVLKAASALGSIGEKNVPNAAAIESAAKALGRLARTATQPGVREAAGLALAKMGSPAAEEILVAALDDPVAGVRFSAAQGLATLGKVSEKTVLAIAQHLQDENKGMRQAVAAGLAKLGGPEAARRMADRLKAGAETEPSVRNALWAAIQALADRAGTPDLSLELGDRFFAREGAEEMQRAAAMYEAALAKLPAASKMSPATQALYEKLVDAYLAAGMPDGAVPALRQLLVITPLENATRIRELNQQLGRILLAKEPYTEGIVPLVAAMEGAKPEVRELLVGAIQTRAEALLKAEKPEAAMDILNAFKRARPDWGATSQAPALPALAAQATDAAIAQAIAKLSGAGDQAAVGAATLKKIGQPALARLLDSLETAAKDKQTPLEEKLLTATETVTGRKDHGYTVQLPLDERLKKIAAWRQAP